MQAELPAIIGSSSHFFLLQGNHHQGFPNLYFSGKPTSEPIPGFYYGLILPYPASLSQQGPYASLYEPSLTNYIQADKINHFTSLDELCGPFAEPSPIEIKPLLTKHEYLEKIKALKRHIQLGDIYEVNFCMEFTAEGVEIDPLHIYHRLQSVSDAPFSVFVKNGDTFIIGSSPERFLKKEGKKLLSQPIKGTAKRGVTEQEDKALKAQLANSLKERTENVMIVDVVRNDLSKVAQKGSLQVDELFGIYSYKQVHQMISTVSCQLRSEITINDMLNAAFPMASMTGAPKRRACELIQQYEPSQRGYYSGSIGYMDARGNFDLNVVIRTIIYNDKTKSLSFHVGSAITAMCDPEEEYEECLVKAGGMLRALNANIEGL